MSAFDLRKSLSFLTVATAMLLKTASAQNTIDLMLSWNEKNARWQGQVQYSAEQGVYRWKSGSSKVSEVRALGKGWSRELTVSPEINLPEGTLSLCFVFEWPSTYAEQHTLKLGVGGQAWGLPHPNILEAAEIKLSVVCEPDWTVQWATDIEAIIAGESSELRLFSATPRALLSDLTLFVDRDPKFVVAGIGSQDLRNQTEPNNGDEPRQILPTDWSEDRIRDSESDTSRNVAWSYWQKKLHYRSVATDDEARWSSRERFFLSENTSRESSEHRAQALVDYYLSWTDSSNLERMRAMAVDSDSASPPTTGAHPLWAQLFAGSNHPILTIRQRAEKGKLKLDYNCIGCPETLELPFVWILGAMRGTELFRVDKAIGTWTLSAEGIPNYARFDLASGIPVECVEERSGNSYLADFADAPLTIERIQAFSGLIAHSSDQLLRTACSIGLRDPSSAIRLMALEALAQQPRERQVFFRGELEACARADLDPLVRELAAQMLSNL